jgi:hypothetical protein
MSKTDNGGPAFPAAEAGQQHFNDPSAYLGMTLRDYFAAKAMQVLLPRMVEGFEAAHEKDGRTAAEHARRTCIAAYMTADAMIKVRSE